MLDDWELAIFSINLSILKTFSIFCALLFFKGLVLFPLMSIYISWSIIQWMLNHDRLSGESQIKSEKPGD